MKNRDNAPETFFADPARADPETLERQIQAVCTHPLTTTLLESLNGAAIILNQYRQVIAANDALIRRLGLTDPSDALGLRPGEALACKSVSNAPNGCGTGKECRSCGAVITILACQKVSHPVEDECYITRNVNGLEEQLTFSVRASPLIIGDFRFQVFTLLDIRQKKWAAALERVFLHDMLNYLQALRGSCELLLLDDRLNADRSLINQIQNLSDHLSETTAAHRDLTLMENGQYEPRRMNVSVQEIFDRVRQYSMFSSAVRHRTLVMSPIRQHHVVCTDPTLLVRILVNMVKNALEATPPGGEVRLSHERTESDHCFRVWNPGKIPEAVALRIFQRYFSTKGGPGRGLGTYSMKLLGERYLGGAVRFDTSDSGTVFEFFLKRCEG